MDLIQGDLDATTMRIEALREQTDLLAAEIARIESRRAELQEQRAGLMDDAVARANELYRSGSIDSLEVLFSSADFGELADRAQVLSQVSRQDARVFVRLSRAEAELKLLNKDLLARQGDLEENSKELAEENKKLQAQFREVASEYQTLRRKLAQAQRMPAPSTDGRSSPSVKVKVTGDMTCPVAGPVSFTDTWGAPRDGGRTHEGTDMMADYGTPLVAITSGTATYVAYDGSGGYMVFLDGDDGNAYYYMHNQENLVSTGQRVTVGEQIATVGDTGNAAGTPHVHFEYHPGGGAASNPFPLVSSLC